MMQPDAVVSVSTVLFRLEFSSKAGEAQEVLTRKTEQDCGCCKDYRCQEPRLLIDSLKVHFLPTTSREQASKLQPDTET